MTELALAPQAPRLEEVEPPVMVRRRVVESEVGLDQPRVVRIVVTHRAEAVRQLGRARPPPIDVDRVLAEGAPRLALGGGSGLGGIRVRVRGWG